MKMPAGWAGIFFTGFPGETAMSSFGRSLASGCVAMLAALCGVAAQAQAQTYPARSITMIVPFAAGGPTDVISRIVTSHMAQTLGQSIIIENVVGAGGHHRHHARGARRQ
jgi:tripartite-type tricarboxylate transporter receptor subunit TctC